MLLNIKMRIVTLILIAPMLLSMISICYADGSVTIDYPVDGNYYNNITQFNGTLTTIDDPVTHDGESYVRYRLNCTNGTGSYYFNSVTDGWDEVESSNTWNDVSYINIDAGESTSWNATVTESQIPSTFIDGTCILNMSAVDYPGEPLTAQGINFTFDTTAPQITITSPTTSTSTYKQPGQNITINYTYTEPNPKNLTLYLLNQTNDTINIMSLNEANLKSGWNNGGINESGSTYITIPNNATTGTYHVYAVMYDLIGYNNTTIQSKSTYVTGAFNFTGNTYNITGGALSGTNASIYVYQMLPNQGPSLVESYTVQSNATGGFNIINITAHNNLFYKPVMRHFTGTDLNYIGPSLPEFPLMEMQNLGSIDFYLKEGATLNITAIGRSQKLDNVTVSNTWNITASLTESGITTLSNIKGLEWNNDISRWAYITISNSNKLILLNTSFEYNNSYDVNFLSMQDFDVVNNTYYIINFNATGEGYAGVNKSQVRKYVVNATDDLELNQTFNLSQNYSEVSSIEYDSNSSQFYVLGMNISGNVTVDIYNETFDYNRSIHPDIMTGKLERPDSDYWFVAAEDEIFKLNNSFAQVGDLWNAVNLSVRGIEYKDGNWYINLNSSFNVTKKIELYGTSAKSFGYMIKDTKLGYPIAEQFGSEGVAQATVYLPADRNYSIMIYPQESFPVSYEVDNLSACETPKKVNIEFNCTDEWKWVSGYVNYQGYSNFTNLTIIAFLLEPGNMVFKDHPLPQNLSAWRIDENGNSQNETDFYNATAGFYNITLPASAMGSDMMLFANAQNITDYYGNFKNLTLLLSGADETEFNFTLYKLVGDYSNLSADKSSSGGGEMGSVKIPTRECSFNLTNGTSSPNHAHVEVKLDYTDINGSEFTFMADVSQSDEGIFKLPLLNYSISRINVFSQDFAPRKLSLEASALTTQPVVITLKSFNPGGMPGEGEMPDVYIDMYKSNPACDVPYPGVNCSIFSKGGEENKKQFSKGNKTGEGMFNPLTAVMGGGTISFRMKKASNNITVHYVNVDMLASGPPDAVFDSNSSDTEGTDTFEQVWKFGSEGPEIYDYVIIGIPYTQASASETGLNESSAINLEIPLLYGENLTAPPIWNASANNNNISLINTNDSLKDFRDYVNNSYEVYLNGTKIICNASDENLTGLCYKDITGNMIWFKIPHFSGVGPENDGTILKADGASCTSASECFSSYCCSGVCSSSSCSTDENGGSSGGGSSGLPSYWTTTYIVNDEDFEAGYTRALSEKKRVRVSVNNESHYIGIVNLTNTTVTINVSSTPQQATLLIGEEKKFDVTDNNFYDIYVKLNDITNNTANLTIKKIHEEIVVEEEVDEEIPEEEGTKEQIDEEIPEEEGTEEEETTEKEPKLPIAVIIVALIALVVGIGYYFKVYQKRQGLI